MVSEGWRLSDFLAFADEYQITYTIQDKLGNVIPSDKYDAYKDSVIQNQSRKPGDRILTNVTQKITLNVEYKTEEKPSDDKKDEKKDEKKDDNNN